MNAIRKRLLRYLWPDTEPKPGLRRGLIVTARFVYALTRDLATGEINLRAMSLVYTTMLAVVPMLAFAFALAKGLGIHRQMEPMLRRILQPIGPRADEFTQTIIGFVDNVSGSVLAFVSVGLLLLTVISMAQKVESSFNFVWRVDRPRSFGRRFSEYLSVILIGPTIMLIAAGLITSLSSQALTNWLADSATIAAWFTRLGNASPYLMVIIAFTFLYLFIPNTRVRFRPALIGGVVAGIVWTGSGYLFTDFVASSGRLEAIYSGFVVIFLAMVWLYLTWLIFLLGSLLAYYIQNPFNLRYGQRTIPVNNSIRERLSLSIMFIVARDFAQPGHGWTDESLAAKLRVPRSIIEPVTAALMAEKLLIRSSESQLLPGRDPHHIKIGDIVAALRGGESGQLPTRQLGIAPVDAVVDRIETAIASELGAGSLGELVDASLANEPEQPDY